jgi:triosephosphate isomerase
VLPESLKAAGASGTLLNHSERRLRLADIAANVDRCREAGLTTILCTNDLSTTIAAAALKPDYIAIEPPELIGSGRAVSTTDPGVVSGAVKAAKPYGVPVLCGAGISRGEDLVAALELGAAGVLLASGVVKSKAPEKALIELLSRL